MDFVVLSLGEDRVWFLRFSVWGGGRDRVWFLRFSVLKKGNIFAPFGIVLLM